MKKLLPFFLALLCFGSSLPPAKQAPFFYQPVVASGGGGGGGTAFITAVSGGSARNDFSGNVGFSFVPAQNMTVTSLGRYVRSGNSQTHKITLVDNSCATLIYTVVSTSGQTAGTFVYNSITPVSLTSGQTYSIYSEEANGLDTWLDQDSTLTFTSAANITASVHDLCVIGISNARSYVPPNFLYTIP